MGEKLCPAPADYGMPDPLGADRTVFDPRLTPARADLAATHLKGQISAPHYARATPMRVTAPLAALYRNPTTAAPRETELLYGEPFSLYDAATGWGWGQAGFDGYVGYVKLEALRPEKDNAFPPTHRVSALRTYIYTQADIKSRPVGLISMNSLLRAAATNADAPRTQGARVTGGAWGTPGASGVSGVSGVSGERFFHEAMGGYIINDHITALIQGPSGRPRIPQADNIVVTAEKFLGTPYLWGGRSSLGLDCSALLQNAFAASDFAIPRDTDQQYRFWMQQDHVRTLHEAPPGAKHPEADAWRSIELQRGDLLYWAGHVALMVNDRDMLHANATGMAVTRDNARDFVSDVSSEAGNVMAIFRPDYLTPDKS